MTLAIVGMFAKGRTTIRNVYNWRVKESDRMVAMVTELTKLGVEVEEGRDFLIVNGIYNNDNNNKNSNNENKNIEKKLKNNVEIDTYDDHRIAMCFSLVACGGVEVTIKDPECTKKTFPDYFEQLKSLSQF